MSTIKTVSARQANHEFSELLSSVERGEEGPDNELVDDRGRHRNAKRPSIVMARGLPWGGTLHEGFAARKYTSGNSQLRYKYLGLRYHCCAAHEDGTGP